MVQTPHNLHTIQHLVPTTIKNPLRNRNPAATTQKNARSVLNLDLGSIQEPYPTYGALGYKPLSQVGSHVG